MSTNFPNGVYSYGQPCDSSGRFANPWANSYFVDYDGGDNGNTGKSPTSAFQTITKAVSVAIGGDVIYINPRAYQMGRGFRRYVEDVTITPGGTSGTGNVATNANISLIGITPRKFPTDFLGVRTKYETATNLTVQAPCTHIENIGFFCEDATYGVHFEADGSYINAGHNGSSMYNCAVKGDGGVYSEGSNELQIINCRFQAKYDGTTSQITLGNNTLQIVRPIIVGCDFIGGNTNNMSVGPINFPYAPVEDCRISNCYFAEAPDSGDYIILAGTTNDGFVADCFFGDDDAKSSLAALASGTTGIYAAGLYDENGCLDMS